MLNIAAVALRSGTHSIGPGDGALRVQTYREGMAQKVGHDLVIEVRDWRANVEVGDDGEPTKITLDVDPSSLHVLEGRRGVKPLTDKDRSEIRSNIDEKILLRRPITFASSDVSVGGDRLAMRGELAIAGTSRPAEFDLELGADGRVRGTLPLTQSDWGIKPYRAFMGALKVRDAVEIVLDVRLPAA